jgi:hypothetical protein
VKALLLIVIAVILTGCGDDRSSGQRSVSKEQVGPALPPAPPSCEIYAEGYCWDDYPNYVGKDENGAETKEEEEEEYVYSRTVSAAGSIPPPPMVYRPKAPIKLPIAPTQTAR